MQSLRLAALLAAAALLLISNVATAKEAGNWIVRAGVTHIAPKSDNGTVPGDPAIDLDVSTATQLTFDGTYMVTNNFGIELLAALPFKHDIDGQVGDTTVELASVKHLPPTLSAVYHFNTSGRWQPYLGAGVNWTIFFDEKEKDALGDASLKLTNSLGFAAVAGLDIALTERFYLNGNIRWMNIESDVKLDGVEVTKAKIDPLIYAINIGWRLGGG